MAYDKIPSQATLKATPYTLNVPQNEVDDFYELIKRSKLAPKTYENLQKETSKYGVTYEWMSQTKEYWATSYDWRKREEYINSFPHFMTQIKDDDGYVFDIHFVALFSNKKDAIPITFLHGWPGSFLEFLGVLNLLRKKYSADDLPYHVIVPSLPGYTLSSGPPLDKDFITEDIARVINKLMVGLGFESGYVAQGGDIGSYTCRPLSTYPSCKAVHLNFSWMPEPSGIDKASINEAEKKGIAQTNEFAATQSAYALEHGTRTATIGFVLSASPLAILAWIGEKFITWTDTTPSTETILDSISLYWFTQSFARCIYPYRQFHHSTQEAYTIHDDPKYFVKTLGYSFFPHEVAPVPRAWVATTGNLVWHRQHDAGGHFAALERPDTILDDVEDFVKQVWK